MKEGKRICPVCGQEVETRLGEKQAERPSTVGAARAAEPQVRRRTNMEKLLLEDMHDQVMRLLLREKIICPTCPARAYCEKQPGPVCCREVLEEWGKEMADAVDHAVSGE
ncbi:hypothetical protein [uncultured Dysosmobacter sp.]|uniref:hypothetical protein n=1 Tax=uncultured Dysosmobacter sp. TaxID=2591384 RepID=UPI00260F447D|nr:hypothetical protein [uncultured Dysosmobacter sp.]